jgi:hypothetical protein
MKIRTHKFNYRTKSNFRGRFAKLFITSSVFIEILRWIDIRANPVSRFSLILFLKHDFNLFNIENDLSVETGNVTNIDIKHHIFGKKSTDSLFKVSITDLDFWQTTEHLQLFWGLCFG